MDNPVYLLLELGELNGALANLSAIKPYSRSTVIKLLETLASTPSAFSSHERIQIQSFLDFFTAPKEGLAHGNVSFRHTSLPAEAADTGTGSTGEWTTTLLGQSDESAAAAGIRTEGSRSLRIGGNVLSDFRVNANNGTDWHFHNLIRGYIQGDLASWFSYYGSVGATYDKIGYSSFAPYDFTKEWDAFHISFEEPRYSDGALAYPTFSYHLETDMTAQFLNDDVTLRFARLRRDWGFGDGNFSLSESARPFVGIEGQFRFAPWISLSHLVGSLANHSLEDGVKNSDEALTYQKNYTLQRLELFPFDWLYLSTSSSVLWSKSFELGYMAPLIFAMIYQNLVGDLDNVGIQVDLAVKVPKIGRLYFSFFADEMEITDLSELFTRPRNMFALQGGVNAPVPFLPLTKFTFQYTKVEPFVYAHYPTNYPDYRNPVDTAYTHDGENLGFRLPPNSDEFLIKFESMPLSNLTASLGWRLIRHGDNPSAQVGDLAVLGDVNKWLDYNQISSIPDKDFLHDGLYDWTNIIELEGSWQFKGFPLRLTAGYSFTHTFWVVNNSGEAPRPDEIRNIFKLGVQLFY